MNRKSIQSLNANLQRSNKAATKAIALSLKIDKASLKGKSTAILEKQFDKLLKEIQA